MAANEFWEGEVPAGITPVRIPPAWVRLLAVLYAVGVIGPIGVMLLFPSAFEGRGDNTSAGILSTVLLFLLVLEVGGVILVAKILYRAWTAIQDKYARTTPGRAVGFLFIPLFNLYWIFVAWAGFAKNFNSFVFRYGIPARRLPEGFFTAQCILVLLGILIQRIPDIGLVYAAAVGLTGVIMAWETTDAINEVHDFLTQGLPEPAVSR